jgi:hypothetical protein
MGQAPGEKLVFRKVQRRPVVRRVQGRDLPTDGEVVFQLKEPNSASGSSWTVSQEGERRIIREWTYRSAGWRSEEEKGRGKGKWE